MAYKYISPTGNDSSGTGLIGAPWLTIQKWIDSGPVAGDTLYVRGGTYSSAPSAVAGHLKNGLMGTAGSPITIRNYPGETPVFSGGGGALIGISGDTNPSAYVIIDGLQITGRSLGQTGAIYVGAWGSSYNVDHVTIRNLKYTAAAGDDLDHAHGVYVSRACRYTTIEDSVFIGSTSTGSGVTTGSWSTSPAPTDIVIQRCVFKSFTQGAIIPWHETSQADADAMNVLISHCSFIGNTNLGDMRIERHGPTTVINCATTNSYVAPTPWTAQTQPCGDPWIYHYYRSIEDVTQTNNFFNQTFDANYYLDAGDTGWKAATDGTDAGALDVYVPGTYSSYYISPTGSDVTGLGTLASPWKTLGMFYSLPPVPGDTLYCRGGTYTSQPYVVVTGVSGSSGSPITVRNYPGEVPLFQGPGTNYSQVIKFRNGANYHVVDGLQFSNWKPTSTGIITVNDASATISTHHITVRNCKVTFTAGLPQTDHFFYASARSDYVIFEDNFCVGPGDTSGGSAFEHYHPPLTNFLVQRNIFDGWYRAAVSVWDGDGELDTCNGSILHNTFVNCGRNMDLRYHGPIVVRDNAGENASLGVAYNIYDPNDSAQTTADHNFWGQTFDANYYLDEFDTGWKAASDGTDAGAFNVETGVPGPGVGLTHAWVAPHADGSDPNRLQPSHWNAEHVIGGLRILANAGSPEYVVSAPVGSLYLRTDGSTSTTLYVKTSGTGNTGWTPK